MLSACGCPQQYCVATVLQVLLHSYLLPPQVPLLFAAAAGSTPICCRRRFHSYLLPPQVPLLFASNQPPTCALNTPAPTLNPTIHTYIQCSAAQYNIQQYTIQTIPYAQYCCYLTLLLLLVLLSCTYSVSPPHFLPPGDFSPAAHAVCQDATHRHP